MNHHCDQKMTDLDFGIIKVTVRSNFWNSFLTASFLYILSEFLAHVLVTRRIIMADYENQGPLGTKASNLVKIGNMVYLWKIS